MKPGLGGSKAQNAETVKPKGHLELKLERLSKRKRITVQSLWGSRLVGKTFGRKACRVRRKPGEGRYRIGGSSCG